MVRKVGGGILLALGGLSTLGYAAGIPSFAEWGLYASMALNTAIGVLLLGAALLLQIELESGMESTWSWLSAPLTTGVLAATFVVAHALDRHDQAQVDRLLDREMEVFAAQLHNDYQMRSRSLNRVAARWRTARAPISREEWEADAGRISAKARRGQEINLQLQAEVKERQRAETALQEAHTLQSLVLANATVGIGLVVDRKFKWVNHHAADMVGIPYERLLGGPTRLLYPDEQTWTYIGEEGYAALGRGEAFEAELQLRRPDGRAFWCRFVGKALVEGMRGSIRVESELGKGTRFLIDLPA
jgi:PAS domain-containing protein